MNITSLALKLYRISEIQVKKTIDQNLKKICQEIIDEKKTIQDWIDIESDDYFNDGSYSGGFDSIEEAFCFSFYNEQGEEFWFQISLEDCERIIHGDQKTILMRRVI